MHGAVALTFWFMLGAIVGFLWTNISPTRSSQSGFANVAVGGTGAMIGGSLTRWAAGDGSAETSVFSFPVAFALAVLSLLVFKAVAGRRRGAAA
jgi:uncharacterized membrane protein YeaQ/YmgE (transglycosylase-associated protein family)